MSHALRTAGRVLLGALMVAAGTLHLTAARTTFRAQVPDSFPFDKDVTVLGSGIVEIALGTAFIFVPRYQRLIGGLLAAFYVLVFPGNISQYVQGVDAFGLDTDMKRLVRLFFQPLLVLWALWAGSVLRRRSRPSPQ